MNLFFDKLACKGLTSLLSGASSLGLLSGDEVFPVILGGFIKKNYN